MAKAKKAVVVKSPEKKALAESPQVQIMAPVEMMQMALKGGVDPAQLKELFAVQKDWEANEARKAYHVAMTDFKANPPEISKDKKVNYKTKQGGVVKYAHASLANVVKQINVALSKQGLSASWRTQQNGKIVVTCRIAHVLGHYEETSLAAESDTSGSKNPIQAISSTVSYLERYTLLALTGLATYDQDNDGASAPSGKPEVAMPQTNDPTKESIIKEIHGLARTHWPTSKEPYQKFLRDKFGTTDEMSLSMDSLDKILSSMLDLVNS